ncbi:glycosyltransferase [Vibrio sinaloensis]|nr:glycosyltransferase [Vibrio sinaloensis]
MSLSRHSVSCPRSIKTAHLLLVGPNEEHYDELFFNHLNNTNVHRVGFTNSPEDYYSVGDIFVLPSYREGFGTSVLEAAAAGLPAIASSIYGLSDAIEDQKNRDFGACQR